MYDVLVVGAGIAGLTVALQAAQGGASVAILTKSIRSGIGSSNLAQGGIASVTTSHDSIESHVVDTLEAGDGLCRVDRVQILAELGPKTIQQLIAWGVNFSRNADNSYQLALEGGHSHRRILHAADLTGAEIMRALLAQVHQRPQIQFLENLYATKLLQGKDRLKGIEVIHLRTGVPQRILAKVTVLATGGSGRLWLHSTNPPLSTGDGVALAYQAGAILEDLEFMQFHPTALYDPTAKQTFLISEAVRGFGGILKNHLGEEFMNSVHPLRSLAPRDIVARAIHAEMARTGKPHMWLDATHRKGKEFCLRFPNIYAHCHGLGIDPGKDWIPVVPAAHYMCGGIKVDAWSRTSVNGLYACGEVAATGVHGANRLASNSLLESVAFSLRAWDKIRLELPKLAMPHSSAQLPKSAKIEKNSYWETQTLRLRKLMWDQCGIVRSLAGLQKGLEQVEDWLQKTNDECCIGGLQYKNQLTLAKLVLEAAIHRKESRGLHYLLDHPEKRQSYRKHFQIQKVTKR